MYDHFVQTKKHNDQRVMTLWNSANEAKVVVEKVALHGHKEVDSSLICDSMHMCDRSNASWLDTFHTQVLHA